MNVVKNENLCVTDDVILKMLRLIKKHKTVTSFRSDPAVGRMCKYAKRNLPKNKNGMTKKCDMNNVLKLCRFIKSSRFSKTFTKLKKDKNARMILDLILLIKQQNRSITIDKNKKTINISKSKSTKKIKNQRGGGIVTNVIDVVDLISAIVGLIPGVGIVADVIGIFTSLIAMDFVGLFLSIVAVTEIPLVSQGAGGIEVIWKIFRLIRRSKKAKRIIYASPRPRPRHRYY